MDVLSKIYEMASTGHSVGFRPSKLTGNHITLVVRKGTLTTEVDVTQAAFTSHQVMNAVLGDVEEEFKKGTFHKQS